MKVLVGLVLLAGCGSVGNEDKKDARPVDTKLADTATDTATPFSPSQLSGLVLWLDAEKGVVATSNKVSGWADQSGANNSAAQLTAARQPTLVANVIHGHSVLRFDGTSTVLQVPDSTSLNWGTDDFTLVAVGSWTNAVTTYAAFYTKQIENVSPYAGGSIWANFPAPSQSTKFGFQLDATAGHYISSTTASLNDGTPRVLLGHRTGSQIEVRVNGASENTADTTTALDTSSTGYNAYIGGHISGSSVIQQLNGDIAEIIAVHGTLTTTQISQLELYLKTKYGL